MRASLLERRRERNDAPRVIQLEAEHYVGRAARRQATPADEVACLDRLLRCIAGHRDLGLGHGVTSCCRSLVGRLDLGSNRIGMIGARARHDRRNEREPQRGHAAPISFVWPPKYPACAFLMPTIDTTCSACACDGYTPDRSGGGGFPLA